MYKKVLALMLAIMFIGGGVVFASELNIKDKLLDLPNLKQGIAYSMLDNKIEYLTTIKLLEVKDVALEAGYSSSDKAVAVLSYELLNLEKKGIDIPILDLVKARIGLYAGLSRIGLGLGNSKENNEFDWGLSATLLEVCW